MVKFDHVRIEHARGKGEVIRQKKCSGGQKHVTDQKNHVFRKKKPKQLFFSFLVFEAKFSLVDVLRAIFWILMPKTTVLGIKIQKVARSTPTSENFASKTKNEKKGFLVFFSEKHDFFGR